MVALYEYITFHTSHYLTRYVQVRNKIPPSAVLIIQAPLIHSGQRIILIVAGLTSRGNRLGDHHYHATILEP